MITSGGMGSGESGQRNFEGRKSQSTGSGKLMNSGLFDGDSDGKFARGGNLQGVRRKLDGGLSVGVRLAGN